MPDSLIGSSPRVLLTTDAVGGVWRYSLDLARAMAGRGAGRAGAGAVGGAARRRRPIVRVVETGLPLDWTAGRTRANSRRCGGWAARDLAERGGGGIRASACAGLGRMRERWPVPVVAVAHSCVATWWDGGARRFVATRSGLARRSRPGSRAADGRCRHRADPRACRGDAGAPMVMFRVWRSCITARPLTGRLRGREIGGAAVLTAGRLWDDGEERCPRSTGAAPKRWMHRSTGCRIHLPGRTARGHHAAEPASSRHSGAGRGCGCAYG